MIDTHAHIDTLQFAEDREETIARALDSGVEKIIIPSIDPADFDSLQQLVDSHEFLYRGIGIHPHNVADKNGSHLEIVENGSNKTRVVAIGEIGLDYYYDFAPKQTQIDFFREQLRIAKRTQLPVIIHNREADDDVLSIVEQEQDGTLRGVLHCFSSSVDVMKRAMDVGLHISFTGNITFKKSTLNEVVQQVPADRFMIETDSPYIAPVPHRGKRNEPMHVKYVAEKIAELRSISFNEVVSMTTNTAKKLFVLSTLLLFCSVSAFAQSEDIEDMEFEHPYPKKLGVSLILATNTVVESRIYGLRIEGGNTDLKDKSQSISYDGIFTYGGSVLYGASDKFLLEAGYLYSKNTKPTDVVNGVQGQPNPNIHQVYEVSAHFIPNPYSRLNFFGTLGGVYSMNRYGYKEEQVHDRFGLGIGAGLYANIKTPIGLVTPSMEWRVNFALGDIQNSRVFAPSGIEYRADYSLLFSLPRFTIVYYPKF